MKWPISRIADAYQVSPAAVRDACRIFGKPIFGNVVWFEKRPSPEFYQEALLSHRAYEAQKARRIKIPPRP